MSSFDSSYEVLVLERERWSVRHVADSQGDAMAMAMELSRRPGAKGVRVVKDFHNAATGLSYEKVLFEQLKENQSSRVRMSSR